MKTKIKLSIAALITISFSSCQTMSSAPDHDRVLPPVLKHDSGPMIVC